MYIMNWWRLQNTFSCMMCLLTMVCTIDQSNGTVWVGITPDVSRAAKNATFKNYPRDIFCDKNHNNISSSSIKIAKAWNFVWLTTWPMKGASIWLTTFPLNEHGFAFHKSGFQDVIQSALTLYSNSLCLWGFFSCGSCALLSEGGFTFSPS